MHFTPLAASCSNSPRNASTADLSEKSIPPPARSSGDLTGTPTAETADVSAPKPAKNSQNKKRRGSRAASKYPPSLCPTGRRGGSASWAPSPSRCLLVTSLGSHKGALRWTGVPKTPATCAPPHLVTLPPWPLPPPLPLPWPLPPLLTWLSLPLPLPWLWLPLLLLLALPWLPLSAWA